MNARSDDPSYASFLREIDRQCRFVGVAAAHLAKATAQRQSLWEQSSAQLSSEGHIDFVTFGLLISTENDQIWYSVQSLLAAAANVSRLLWPVPSPRKQESTDAFEKRTEIASRLRVDLGIEVKSDIKSKELRHHFEHFDERLGSWAYTEPISLVEDAALVGDDVVTGDSSSNMLRTFNTTSYIATFRNEQYQLHPVIEEARRLAALAHQKSLEYSRQLRMSNAVMCGDDAAFMRELVGTDRLEIHIGNERSEIRFDPVTKKPD